MMINSSARYYRGEKSGDMIATDKRTFPKHKKNKLIRYRRKHHKMWENASK